MRVVSSLVVLALFAACGPAAEEEEAQPAGPTLADFAGTWQNSTTLDGVADPVPSTMIGSADGSSWTMTLEGRENIPMTVSLKGDSLIAQTDEYESVLRAGVMVSVRMAAVLEDGMLMGTLVATYNTPDGTEQVNGTTHGTRAN